MDSRVCFGVLLLAALPLWSQVQPSATGGDEITPDNEFEMSLPPQVNGGHGTPMSFGSQARSNYLSGGVILTGAYDDNIMAGGQLAPIRDGSIAIVPTIGYHISTARLSTMLNYGAGFTFYMANSVFNQVNQNAAFNLDYHTSRHSTLSIQDSFQQNSSLLSQPYTFNGGVPGSTANPSSSIIVPYASQILNSTNIAFGYQYSRDAMIGGAGSYGIYRLPNVSQLTGLNNSNSASGLGFYMRRIVKGQYLGAIYQYGHITTNPVDTTTNVQIGSIFYTLQPSTRFSLALTAGPEFFTTSEPGHPGSSSLGAFLLASLAWRTMHTAWGASYAHAVTAGQGLLGAYTSDSFNVSANWQFQRTWSTGISGAYLNLATALPVSIPSTPGGHTFFGTVSLSHQLSERLNIEADYRRLHQSYRDITIVSSSPDDDRVSVSLYYQFTRPVGR